MSDKKPNSTVFFIVSFLLLAISACIRNTVPQKLILTEPLGLSRSRPYPRSEIVHAPNWDIQVVDVKRGDEALEIIKAVRPDAELPPRGMEYFTIKVYVKNTSTDGSEHTIGICDFEVTGDRLHPYSCVDSMKDDLDDFLFGDETTGVEFWFYENLLPGGEAAGWIKFIVGEGEGNLLLSIRDISSLTENPPLFIAMEDHASIRISSDLAGIRPTDSGKYLDNPAPLSEKLITENWEIRVLEVFRGEKAWKMIREANQLNRLPPEGFEYITAKVHLRYIGTEDRSIDVYHAYFKTASSTGVNEGELMLLPPSPILSDSLYPGGETEGWVVLIVSESETGISIVFEPPHDYDHIERRFISIEP